MFVKKGICRRHQFLSSYIFCVVEFINKYGKYIWAHCLTEEDDDGKKYKEWNRHVEWI